MKKEAIDKFKEAILEVLEIEGPLCFNDIFDYVDEAWESLNAEGTLVKVK